MMDPSFAPAPEPLVPTRDSERPRHPLRLRQLRRRNTNSRRMPPPDVADSPASKYNPLFIFGGVGLGKTHLLHAVGTGIHPSTRTGSITVVTCEQFVTSFIGSMLTSARQAGQSASTNLMDEFRQRYREPPTCFWWTISSSSLARQLAGRVSFTRSTPFIMPQGRSILTCDKAARRLPGVEERLRSRFTWGLIAEIGHPDLEPALPILKHKAELEL